MPLDSTIYLIFRMLDGVSDVWRSVCQKPKKGAHSAYQLAAGCGFQFHG
jgi:hypothetical protein